MLVILIVACFIVAALVPAMTKNRRAVELAAIGASVIAFSLSAFIAYRVGTRGTYNPFPAISVDAIGAIVILLVATVGCFAAIYSAPYFHKEMFQNIIGLKRVREYYILSNLFLSVMFLSATSSHPVEAWICLEATTLTTVFLISYYNKLTTIEAAWKYLIINSTGLLMAFFGTLLYFTSVSKGVDGSFVSWHTLEMAVNNFNPAVARIAFVFVLIGYGTKVGLVPMHTWKPDAYSNTPAPMGALLSGALMPVALVTILRFKVITDAAVGPLFSQHLLIAFGLISIVVAALSIVTVRDYKRLLAYSSIEHAGIMALGFGFGGLGALAAIVHMIYHSLIKSSLFFTAGNIFIKYRSSEIKLVKGAMSIIPVTSVLFLTAFFAITGLPPFGIFLTELFTLSAGVRHYLLFVIIALAAMAILFIGFLRHASSITLSETPEGVEKGEDSIWLLLPPAVLLVLVLVMTFYTPPFMLTLIHEAAARY